VTVVNSQFRRLGDIAPLHKAAFRKCADVFWLMWVLGCAMGCFSESFRDPLGYFGVLWKSLGHLRVTWHPRSPLSLSGEVSRKLWVHSDSKVLCFGTSQVALVFCCRLSPFFEGSLEQVWKSLLIFIALGHVVAVCRWGRRLDCGWCCELLCIAVGVALAVGRCG
jgi:hypothetical protein